MKLDHLIAFCARVNADITIIVKLMAQLDNASISPLARAHLLLPIRYCGTGLQLLADRQDTEYIDGLVQDVPPLVDCRTKERITLPGRLCTNHMQEWLGLNYFINTSNVNPWDTLLTHTVFPPIIIALTPPGTSSKKKYVASLWTTTW